jgi:hypothetical protein
MSGKWHGGKGSNPRPYSVDRKTFDSNWDLAFKKDKPKDPPPEETNQSTEEKPDK